MNLQMPANLMSPYCCTDERAMFFVSSFTNQFPQNEGDKPNISTAITCSIIFRCSARVDHFKEYVFIFLFIFHICNTVSLKVL